MMNTWGHAGSNLSSAAMLARSRKRSGYQNLSQKFKRWKQRMSSSLKNVIYIWLGFLFGGGFLLFFFLCLF